MRAVIAWGRNGLRLCFGCRKLFTLALILLGILLVHHARIYHLNGGQHDASPPWGKRVKDQA